MKITEKLKVALKSMLSVKLAEIVTDKETLIFDAEELAEGVEVFIKREEEIVPAEDGEYTSEDGRIIVVAEGKVTEIKEVEKEKVEVEAEVIVEPTDAPVEVEVEDDELKRKMEEITGALTEILNSIAALEGRIDDINERVTKLEKEPIADPVEVEVEEPVKMSRMSYLRKK